MIVKCKSCELLYTLPKLSANELLKFYPNSYSAYSDNIEDFAKQINLNKKKIPLWKLFYGRILYKEVLGVGFTKKVATFLNMLNRFILIISGVHFCDYFPNLLPIKKLPGKYLHIGAGTGGRFVELLNEGWNVFAIDINRELMKKWSDITPVKASHGYIKETQFQRNSFDIVFMSHVLEHLTDPINELGVINSLLKHKGIFVCSLPLYKTMGFNIDDKYVYYDVPRHTMHFTLKPLYQLMDKAGFEIKKIIILPYWHGFYFSDYKRYCLTGKPLDSTQFNVERFEDLPLRHKLKGYIAWLLQSTGNICFYAIKK